MLITLHTYQACVGSCFISNIVRTKAMLTEKSQSAHIKLMSQHHQRHRSEAHNRLFELSSMNFQFITNVRPHVLPGLLLLGCLFEIFEQNECKFYARCSYYLPNLLSVVFSVVSSDKIMETVLNIFLK